MSEITYTQEDGSLAVVQFEEGKPGPIPGGVPGTLNWTAKRELFCRHIACGMEPIAAYSDAYKNENPITCSHAAGRLLADTDVQLRIQQLKEPVVRKFRKKLEYNLQQALEECDTAHRLAYIKGDPKTMLKAVELRAKLVKLLGNEEINVNHRYGLLDETSTETLLEMKKQIEVRRGKLKEIGGIPGGEKNRAAGQVVEARAEVVS